MSMRKREKKNLPVDEPLLEGYSESDEPSEQGPETHNGQEPVQERGHPSRTQYPDPMLRWFECDHLAKPLADFSRSFQVLAFLIAGSLPSSAERTVALRKLLEAKDAAVRAKLDTQG